MTEYGTELLRRQLNGRFATFVDACTVGGIGPCPDGFRVHLRRNATGPVPVTASDSAAASLLFLLQCKALESKASVSPPFSDTLLVFAVQIWPKTPLIWCR